jgi:hypothetical protein
VSIDVPLVTSIDPDPKLSFHVAIEIVSDLAIRLDVLEVPSPPAIMLTNPPTPLETCTSPATPSITEPLEIRRDPVEPCCADPDVKTRDPEGEETVDED